MSSMMKTLNEGSDQFQHSAYTLRISGTPYLEKAVTQP
jgi:hypothetical protein